MSQSEILLHLFYKFITGKTVHKDAFCCDMHISERSFYRYLAKLRNFSIESDFAFEIEADGDGNYRMKTKDSE